VAGADQEGAINLNIYAERGDKVVFINRNGHDYEPGDARDIGLVEGGVYSVERTEVGGWHTEVYLQEFPNQGFNSVMFEDFVEEELDTNMHITKRHLGFLEEAKAIFESNPKQVTHQNDDKDLIALRYGADRDCIKIHELGEEIGFFAQMMDKSPELVVPFKYEQIQWFGGEMEKQMKANHYKGKWENIVDELLIEEMSKNQGRLSEIMGGAPCDPGEYIRRCANIANFAMMIADKSRAPWEKPL
jgi:hypothetical protein